MIKLHRLNGNEIVVNAELIETIECVPDTKIILNNGNQFIVRESMDCIIGKVQEYKSNIFGKYKQ